MTTETHHQLEWKGRVLGTYTSSKLRIMLNADEISRLHRVKDENGAWHPLGEWLDAHEIQDQSSRNELIRRTELENKLLAENHRNTALENRLKAAESAAAYQPAPHSVSPPTTTGLVDYSNEVDSPRTSGLAVASLIFGILSGLLFISIVGMSKLETVRWIALTYWGLMIFWILSLVFGHLSLSEINRTNSLGGKALALTGLIIGYTVIALISLFILNATLNDYRPLFR